MIKVLLSDFDDTVVTTIGNKWQQHIVAAKKYGVDLDESTIRKHWGEPLSTLIRNLYSLHEASSQEVQMALEYYNTLSPQFPKIIKPGALDLLEGLSEKGIITGIVTATVKANLLTDLELLGFDIPKLDYLQAADETEFHKPDPRVFDPAIAYLMQEHQITDRSEILYIGDSLRDFHAARGAGINFIGIPNNVIEFREDFENAGAMCAENLSVLKEKLETSLEIGNEFNN